MGASLEIFTWDGHVADRKTPSASQLTEDRVVFVVCDVAVQNHKTGRRVHPRQRRRLAARGAGRSVASAQAACAAPAVVAARPSPCTF